MDSDGFEILGTSILGPEPIGAVHLPWCQGIDVIYGRNGVGKTRLLKALQSPRPAGFSKYSGGLGTKMIHIRIDRDLPVFDRDEREWHVHGAWRDSYEAGTNRTEWELAWPGTVLHLGLHSVLEAVSRNRGLEGDPLSDFPLSDSVGVLLAWVVGIMIGEGALAEELGKSPFLTIANDSVSLSVFPAECPELIKFWEEEEKERQRWLKERHELEERAQTEGRTLGKYAGRRPSNPNSVSIPRPPHSWPDWLPFPIMKIGDLPLYVEDTVASWDTAVDLRTNQFLLGIEELVETADDLFALTAQFRGIVETLQGRAAEHLKGLLEGAPDISLTILPPREWIDGQLVRWSAKSLGRHSVDLPDLSHAQLKWVSLSIDLALHEVGKEIAGNRIDRSRFSLLIDEPEQGLHPRAIEYLLDGLRAISAQFGGPIILASHSPQVLGAADVRLHHARQALTGLLELVPFELDAKEELEEAALGIGLTTVDLLQLARVFVLFEGRHDSTVFEELFPEEWRRPGLLFAHLSGSDNTIGVSTEDVLLRYTDAKFVLVLDNVDDYVQGEISKALELAKDGRSREARQALEELKGGNLTHEEKSSVETASRFMKERSDRLFLLGLSKRDISAYLPEEAFGLEESWERLGAEFGESNENDFKKWLKRQHGVRINVDSVREAAQASRQAPHPELEAAMARIVEILDDV